MTNPELAELLDRLMDMACPIISHLAGGRDSNQQPLPGLQDRIDAIPTQVRSLAGWIEEITHHIAKCPRCGERDVSIGMTCHNSKCPDYATERTIYEGWRTPEQGTWWCNAHQREATYLSGDGRRKCDPKLGGIMLPCDVVFVEALITNP